MSEYHPKKISTQTYYKPFLNSTFLILHSKSVLRGAFFLSQLLSGEGVGTAVVLDEEVAVLYYFMIYD